jgi:hypothetical protein
VPGKRTDDEERAARIDQILEELRLNTEDLHELARRARERAVKMRADTAVTRESARRRRPRKKR